MRPKVDPSLRALLEKYPAERSNLIPLLQVVQDQHGWLTEDSMAAIAEYLHVPSSIVYGVATFYAQFYMTPQGKHRVKVCQGTACHVRGSQAIMDQLSSKLGIPPGGTTSDLLFSLERVACFGSCALAPVMVLDGKVHGRVTIKKAEKIVEGVK
ncbi:MAG: NADH dehydrogenase [Deltaproteobacteria bacterium RBG_13_61_14]|nr:MAG: NADH dehydrogenase [Deltaproteobacteria bacterium RBG_13_61_14]